jgi:NAD(P)-dependent dehydrogenase (short-subunit alcohol dehydrogenase family)
LINNAGIVRPASILDSTAAQVDQYAMLPTHPTELPKSDIHDRTFRTNTLSHFTLLRAILPHMLRERRGTIVTISSVLGRLGAANLSSYTASKAALLALHASLRAELAAIPDAQDIKTILVTPGQMGTDMFHGLKTPSNFFAPILSPAEVAKSIMGLIERGESGQVALPLYSRYVEVLGTLPVGVQALIRRWSGVDTAITDAGLVQKVVKEEK